MEPNRTGRAERDKKRNERHHDDRKLHARRDRADDLDGQLGPDELPDAAEVAMNLEAKRHQ